MAWIVFVCVGALPADGTSLADCSTMLSSFRVPASIIDWISLTWLSSESILASWSLESFPILLTLHIACRTTTEPSSRLDALLLQLTR